MKQVYLLRHGKRTQEGVLTDEAKIQAANLGKDLPAFAKVISSGVPRANQTATLIANANPQIDSRAGFYAPAEENSNQISEFGTSNGMDFFEAAETFQNNAFADGIHAMALGLNELIDEVLSQIDEGQAALIVSHDLTIATAMALKGVPRVSSAYLSGYIVDTGGVTRFLPNN